MRGACLHGSDNHLFNFRESHACFVDELHQKPIQEVFFHRNFWFSLNSYFAQSEELSRECTDMATSNMKVSTNDYDCTPGSFNAEGIACTSQLDLNPNCGHLPSYELHRVESCKPELKPEWLLSKEATKRKRVNRIAKLKQCKLDARREQWLSQGSQSRAKHVDDECHDTLAQKGNDSSLDISRDQGSPSDSDCTNSIQTLEFGQNIHSAGNGGTGLSRSTVASMPAGQGKLTIPVTLRDRNLLQLPGSDFTSDESVTTVLTSCLIDRRDNSVLDMHESPATMKSELCVASTVKETGLDQAGGSVCRPEVSGRDGETLIDNTPKQGQGPESLSHSHSHVSAIQLSDACTRNRDDGGSNDSNAHSHPHDGEDDWEAVADAIYMQGPTPKTEEDLELGNVETGDLLDEKGKLSAKMKLQNGALQPEYKYKAGGLVGRTRALGGRAWRPDDAARPPTLPRLSKQHSFPLLSNPPAWTGSQDSNMWGPPPAPLFCPICTEELDLTDSSFVPCSCGFRLCLFCHHRIAADDGRCPGCRKTYNSDVARKLSHASSLWLQI